MPYNKLKKYKLGLLDGTSYHVNTSPSFS